MENEQILLTALPPSVQEWTQDKRIDEVECVIADFAGISKGKAMPWVKFSRQDRMFLPTSIFYQTIAGDYVDMQEEHLQWTENDMVLVPDLSTAVASPWAQSDLTIQIIHDVVDLKGEPVDIVPRNVLKRVLSLYEKENWKPIIAPEMEFYLTRPNTDPDMPIEPMLGRTGRRVASRQAYSMAAVDEYGQVIDDIYDFAEACGFEIDTIIQEGGAGQVEINFIHGDPLKLADQVFYFKRLIREAALRNNCFATFMAKPMQDEPGSAMHIHQSVIDKKTGKNLFNDEHDHHTALFENYLAGQQKFIPSAISLFAPYVNSFRRFVAEGSAPINLEWGYDNRTTGLRVPISTPQARRIENRVVGMDANPYLAIAGSLACGYLGMKNQLRPKRAVKGYGYDKRRDIPRSLLEGVDAFDTAPELQAVLGERFCQVYMAIKRFEAEDFLRVISPWEREHLLLNV